MTCWPGGVGGRKSSAATREESASFGIACCAQGPTLGLQDDTEGHSFFARFASTPYGARASGAHSNGPAKAGALRLGSAQLYELCRVAMCCLVMCGFGCAWALSTGDAGHAVGPPSVSDSMTQRVRACTGCHGLQGGASAEGYVPRIAGKPAGYLHQQLLAFRDGQRRHDGMSRLLEHLDSDFLAEIAAHFAALEVPYPPPPASSSPAPQASLRRGQALVFDGDAAQGVPACAACHGSTLMGVAPAVPGLLGLPQGYLLSQLGAGVWARVVPVRPIAWPRWRNGCRPPM
jgi:cytochrome c553